MSHFELKVCKQLTNQLLDTVLEKFEEQSKIVRTKDDASIVTETDDWVDQVITKKLKTHFPIDALMSEEGNPAEQLTDDRLWLVDPICGTYRFASGVLNFTTNIALYEDLKPVFAFVIDYPKQTYYWTYVDSGEIYQEDIKLETELLDQAKHEVNFDIAYILNESDDKKEALSRIYHDLLFKNFQPLYPSSTLHMTYTALGKYAASVCPSAKPWDLAAAHAFITAAKGVSTNFAGEPWQLKDSTIVCSLENDIHQAIVSTTKEHWQVLWVASSLLIRYRCWIEVISISVFIWWLIFSQKSLIKMGLLVIR